MAIPIQPLKRVVVEALDFDWLFENDNAKVMVQLLASEANNVTLTKKTIKVFIELMWDTYQPEIVRYMFVPYLCYLILISYVGGYCIPNYLQSFYISAKEKE